MIPKENSFIWFIRAIPRAGGGDPSDGVLQYLELQSEKYKGWVDFDGNPRFTLNSRFGCQNGRGCVEEGFMVDIEQFKGAKEFKQLLGYINTASDMQKKGVGGHAK